jgi:hypothetical protein
MISVYQTSKLLRVEVEHAHYRLDTPPALRMLCGMHRNHSNLVAPKEFPRTVCTRSLGAREVRRGYWMYVEALKSF